MYDPTMVRENMEIKYILTANTKIKSITWGGVYWTPIQKDFVGIPINECLVVFSNFTSGHYIDRKSVV